MPKFGEAYKNKRAFQASTLRSILGDLVPGKIDTSDGAGNTTNDHAIMPGSNSCNSLVGTFDFSPSMAEFLPPFLNKQEKDLAPMHGGSPTLGNAIYGNFQSSKNFDSEVENERKNIGRKDHLKGEVGLDDLSVSSWLTSQAFQEHKNKSGLEQNSPMNRDLSYKFSNHAENGFNELKLPPLNLNFSNLHFPSNMAQESSLENNVYSMPMSLDSPDNPLWKRRRVLSNPEMKSLGFGDSMSYDMIQNFHEQFVNEQKDRGKSELFPSEKNQICSSNAGKIECLPSPDKNRFASDDSKVKKESFEMDKAIETKPKPPAGKRSSRPKAGNRGKQIKAESGDARDAGIDFNLWVRVYLGEKCTAAQCTLRNSNFLATRRHYHATCDHKHNAGAKAGMRFHHHQLEKIRKHQRAHLRRANAAEGSVCPDVLPMDVQNALIEAGAECHEPHLWSTAATEKLRTLVDQQHHRSGGGRVSWESVSNTMRATRLPGAALLSPAQCMLHWRKAINQGATVTGVGTWCEAEDKRLGALVRHFKQAWSSVARYMPGREPKQCRERYNNIVNPAINRGAVWTSSEDALLLRLYHEYGNRFAELAKRLPGHSYNDVKNRYNVLQRANRPPGKRTSSRLNPPPISKTEESKVDSKGDTHQPVINNSAMQGGENLGPFRAFSPMCYSGDGSAKDEGFPVGNNAPIGIDLNFSNVQVREPGSRESWIEDASHFGLASPGLNTQDLGLGVVPEGREYEYGYDHGSGDEHSQPW
mmetsp:Transcript_427/g.607  ORF Transcript_427/g.607 Transcript_427/m.607 type:complete len:756 (+) Transcript_427:218-2485(+)|eukprot:CAMPEP_0171454082 /NCGR_PEP_ID=MMETSP0945-20130129/1518_1 /TAXON_ID=109269 /ORGANISM="Vaucheria litorea, Strain CCMP2940" /LENGTH=755 /DNA_ID=CAMNT_0011979049 /DNA_START=202 /DNA_END=2469 /DNA_ORIENTATION=-